MTRAGRNGESDVLASLSKRIMKYGKCRACIKANAVI